MSLPSSHHLLTPDEARAVAQEHAQELLTAPEHDAWADTSINMANASLTPEGEVVVHLLGVVERHRSVDAFLMAYGLASLRPSAA